MKKVISFIAVLGPLAGCTDSFSIITGQARPAITPGLVQVYLQPPARNYDVIGPLSGSIHNKIGISRQAKINTAMRGIKEKAAEIDANGVVLQQAGTEVSGGGAITSHGAVVGGLDHDVVVSCTRSTLRRDADSNY